MKQVSESECISFYIVKIWLVCIVVNAIGGLSTQVGDWGFFSATKSMTLSTGQLEISVTVLNCGEVSTCCRDVSREHLIKPCGWLFVSWEVKAKVNVWTGTIYQLLMKRGGHRLSFIVTYHLMVSGCVSMSSSSSDRKIIIYLLFPPWLGA